MDTVLIPILKSSKCDITDPDNHRPIAVTCIMSKILQLVLLEKYRNCLLTTDNQFAFRKSNSTEHCTFILKK